MASTSAAVINRYYGNVFPETPGFAELHVHLEGTISSETLREIDPALTSEEIAENMRCGTSFADFLCAYIWLNQKLRVPQHYAIATRHMLEQFAAQDIRYAEVTLSAGVILWKGQDLNATWDAIRNECARSTSGVQTQWIPDAVRQFGTEHAMEVARFAVTRRDDGAVAFGIGGDELRGPARLFRDIFAFARDGGLHLVCHAGETGGPEAVREAIDIGAERIGHGIAAVHDPDLLMELKRRGIPLEVCISSNVCTGVVPSAREHPVRRLYEAGVPVTLNTDDPALFCTTLAREFDLAQSLGFTADELRAIAENARAYAFTGA